MFKFTVAEMDKLIKIGALNLEDLEVNRSGELSERQKRGLKLWVGFWVIVAGVEVITLSAIIFIQVFYLSIGFAGLVLFAFMIYLTYLCTMNTKPYWDDLKNDEIYSIAGKMFKHYSRTGGGRKLAIGTCSIQIGRQRFSVSPAICDAVALNEFYRLYYLPHSRRLVNIEPL